MKEALYYRKIENKEVICDLCPHHCNIKNDKLGICKVRKNIDGILYTLNYGIISSAALDPIEKKPLFNFMPGTYIFSIGSIGCNLGCVFCQNWEIATACTSALERSDKNIPVDLIVRLEERRVGKEC